jgi:hypothetical protein
VQCNAWRPTRLSDQQSTWSGQGSCLAIWSWPRSRTRNCRHWHYYHGGVANAPAYQLEISAFGYFPGDTAFSRAYPWLGFRVGVIGTP